MNQPDIGDKCMDSALYLKFNTQAVLKITTKNSLGKERWWEEAEFELPPSGPRGPPLTASPYRPSGGGEKSNPGEQD